VTALAASPAFEVDVIRSGEDLAALAADWNDLWRRVPAASPFQSPHWLIPWWSAFRPGDLRVATVRHGGRLAGLAPLYLEDGALGRRLLPLGISLSDDTDVLVDPGMPGASAALADAVASGRDWESWWMEDLMPGAAGLALPRPAGTADEVAPQSARPVLDLRGERDADGLPLSIPADRRRKVRRAVRLAGARGGLRIERDADPARFVDELARLHGARWTSRGEDGLLADAPVLAFHRAAVPGLAAAGIARLVLVHIAGRVAGAYYGLVHGGRAHAYLGGFDPAFAHESPGAILIAEAMRSAVEEGCTEFDFLRGQEDYKYLWGATDRWTLRRVIRRGS
jgi:CelD/BcsL family acetyltransferase involved in cellulose biosynthesis